MPRLQILQHKSYHPYLETNKQRVRDDEAKAAALEAGEERAALNENSSSRLAYLRNKDTLPLPSSSRLIDPAPDSSALLAARRSEKIRADKREEKRRLEYDWPKEENRAREKQGKPKDKDGEAQGGEVGHVNFWAGLEKSASSAKPARTPDQIQADDPTTMYLHRPLRETRPWYTDVELRTHEERDEDEEKRERRERRRRKDESWKNAHDPMTQVQAALSSTSRPEQNRQQRYSRSAPNQSYPPRISGVDAAPDPLRAARAAREATERARALALVQAAASRKGGMTPMTSTTDDMESVRGESTLWNAQEVREARKRREAVRGWRRGVGGEDQR